MVFHGRLGGIFDLLQIHFKQLGERGGRHAARASDFSLAAALRAADGGVCFDNIADNPGCCERVEHLCVGEAVLLLHIPQHRRHNAACAAGGRGDDRAARSALLADRIGVCAHDPVLPRFGPFVDMPLAEQIARLALQVQAAGQFALRVQPLADGLLHALPYAVQKRHDPVALFLTDVLGNAYVVFGTVGLDFIVGVKAVDGRGGAVGFALDSDLAAAHAEHAQFSERLSVPERIEVHRVRMRRFGRLVKYNFRFGGQGHFQDAVGAVAPARLGERAVQDDPEAVGGRVALGKEPGGALRRDGVRAGRAAAHVVKLTQRLHLLCPLWYDGFRVPGLAWVYVLRRIFRTRRGVPAEFSARSGPGSRRRTARLLTEALRRTPCPARTRAASAQR